MSAQVLSPEDQARANLYGLLARLFYAPPDEELLRKLAQAEDIHAADEGSAIVRTWKDLKVAAAATDPESVREEYESVFIGTGKAAVTLYSTAYMAKADSSRPARHPLVHLRDFLAGRGLARKQGVHEPEDHFAGLCEVMRHLVGENDAAAQRAFYESFIGPSASGLCNAITSSPRVRFYASLARFTAAFLELEQEAVKMD